LPCRGRWIIENADGVPPITTTRNRHIGRIPKGRRAEAARAEHAREGLPGQPAHRSRINVECTAEFEESERRVVPYRPW
jgi:hypothetical protein